MSLVTTTWHGRIAVLTLNRPEKRNAMHQAMWQAMGDAARALLDAAPRAVVVTGTAGHFSAGMDLSMDNPLLATIAQATAVRDEAAVHRTIDWLNAQIDAFTALPCPVIAAIEGVCVGSGLELALAADLRVAAASARFALPETRVGLCPDVGGARRLHALVGPSRTVDLIATCRTLDVAEAQSWGLIDRTCDDGSALEKALELAQQTLISAPTALAATLAYVRTLATPDAESVRQTERDAGTAAVLAGEALEGAAAFAQRRAPRWASNDADPNA